MNLLQKNKRLKRGLAAVLMLLLLLPMLFSCNSRENEEEGTTTEESTETTTPAESGKLEDVVPEFPSDPEKETPPENPEVSLYEWSQQVYSGTTKRGCKTITVLAQYNKGLDYDVYCQKDTTTKQYYLYLPCRVDLSAVTYTVTHKDDTVSGPYTVDLSDTDIDDNERVVGNSNSYVIVAKQSNLPTVMVQVDEQYVTIKELNADPDHKTYAYGDMVTTVTDEMAREKGWSTRYESKDTDPNKHCSLDIRGRGNTTWKLAKRPYQIRCENDIDLLGMGRSGTYAIMANYRDVTGARTQLAMDLGIALGLDYTSRHCQVDFFLNGTYMGMYVIMEKIEVAPNRVEIDEDVDILFEVDQYYAEQGEFGLNLQKYEEQCRFRIHSPTDPGTSARSKRILTSAIDALFSGDEDRFLEWFDLESWAKACFVQLYTMNNDAYHGSFYFYYSNEDGKMHACCPWDFDWSFGVAYGKNELSQDPLTCNWTSRGVAKPMMEYKAFQMALLKLYYEQGGREIIAGMPDRVEAYEEENYLSAQMNITMLGTKVYYYPSAKQSPVYYTSYKEVTDYTSAVDFLYNICRARVRFMENYMQQISIWCKYEPND